MSEQTALAPFPGGPFGGRLKTAYRFVAPPLQIEPASLGFDLALGVKRIGGIYSVTLLQKSTNFGKRFVDFLYPL